MLLLCALIVGSGSAWADTFKKATSISVGDVVILVAEGVGSKAGIELTSISTTSTKYGIGTEYETTPAGTYAFEVVAGNSTGTFAFKNGTNYLYWTSGNSLNVNATLSDNTSWSVTFDNGNAVILNASDNNRQIWWNTGSPRFACYTGKTTSSDGYASVQIYKKAYTVTYAANGGTGTMTDSNSPYFKDATVTLLDNVFTAPAGHTFNGWAVTDASSNVVTVTNNQFTMPASNVTVTAQWQAEGNYITVSPTTKEIISEGGDAEFTITTDQTLDEDPTQFYTSIDGDVATSKPTWITEALYDEGTLILTVAANTGAARTAYFKVENGSVQSNVITINQAAKTYTIDQYTSPATAHGTITFSPASPVETGTEVTLTATPDESYSFTADSWTFYKESGEDFVVDNSITVTDSKITMPAYALYVDATFAPIAVTGVTLNKNAATIGIDETETLIATVAPANALNKAVTWSSSNTSVATVADGMVTGVAEGSATITVTTTDGSFTATCGVSVVNAVTFIAGTDKGSTSANNSPDEVTKSGITISSDNAAFATAEYRFYSGSTTTISTNSGKITRIELTKNGSYYLSNLSTTTGSYTSSTGVWTGTATSVVFSASAQVRLDKIRVFVANTATPTFSVAEGTYDAAQDVTISCATQGATIYYTTDGNTPTSNSTVYSSAVHITETTTLKAIAIKDGIESDGVASATYTMNRPAAPTFDVADGVFDTAFDLHLNTETAEATIYYTTDGNMPTSSSSVYSNKIAIAIGSNVTVKAIAVKNGLTSDVSTVTYTYDARTTPTFSLSTTSLDLKVNEVSSVVTLTTNHDVTPSFTCDDTHITLTGSDKSYTISADAEGTYTVNVSVTGSANYKDAAGTITVNVTKKATTMVIATAFDDGKDLRYASEGLIEGTVKYNDVALASQPTITYSSSDETVATVAANGTITFLKVGSTTLTASFAGNSEYEACQETFVLDLYDTTPQETVVSITLNNTFFGCTSFTSWSTSMATSLSGTNKNVTITYGKGTSANMYCSTEKIRFYTNNVFTIDAPAGYHITEVDMNASISSATPSGTISSDTWTGDATSVSFSFANKTDLTSITVTLAPVVTLNKYGYATYCSAHPIDFSKAEGFTAWRVSNVASDGTITFAKITGTIKEGQGVLLYNKDADGENKTTFTLAIGESDGATVFTNSENKLKGTTVPTEVEADQYYGLSDNAFVPVNKGTIPAGKALLPASEVPNASRLTFVFEDVQGIRTIEHPTMTTDDTVYNLKGQRVVTPKKGLYIMNGKKVMVK